MITDDVPDQCEQYVVVNLPVRLRPSELAMLNAAAARAPNTKSLRASGETMDRARLAHGRAEGLLDLRRKRERVFGDKLFADPAWNMLLDLFVRRLDKKGTSVGTICLASGVAATTALRFLEGLVETGIVLKLASQADQRAQCVILSDEGIRKMMDVIMPEYALS